MEDQPWEQTTLQRARVVAIYDVGETTVVLGADGTAHELQGDSAALAREVLAFLSSPATGDELARHLEALTGESLDDSPVVRDLVSLLLGLEAIVRVARTAGGHTPGPARALRGGQRARVVLGLTGAVGTMHAPTYVQHLQERGFDVRVVATEAAMHFVTATALEALTHHRVVSGLWPPDRQDSSVQADPDDPIELPVPHINLAQWADAVVICPASATTIGRLAGGDFSSVVSAVALTTAAPVLVVPSMNPAMFSSPATQRNLSQLVAHGFHVAHPGSGPEIADAPHLRGPSLGASVPPRVVYGLVETMLRRHGSQPMSSSPTPAQWDAMFRTRATEDLPWNTERMDDDLRALVADIAGAPASILDVGTGLGTIASACAAQGHRVVAIDVSQAALERAHELAPEAGVVWLQDDITDSSLRSQFDLVIDRGCLGLLSDAAARSYAGELARLTVPGGAVMLKVLVGEAASSRGATSHTAATISALFGERFSLTRHSPSTMPGASGNTPSASVFVLRRGA